MDNQFRKSIPADRAKFIKVHEIEKKSGAKVSIINKSKSKPLAIITGNETQRKIAMTLIDESLNKAFVIPAIGFKLLELDNVINANKAKFQFIKYDEDVANPTKSKAPYFVKLMKDYDKQESSEIDDLAFLFDKKLEVSSHSLNRGFTTSDKLDYCLEKIYAQLSNADPTDIERREIRLNLFFGRQLFYNDDVKKKVFDVDDWMKFSQRGTLFQQNAPQVLEKMEILEKEFGFKEDKHKITSEDKGSIAIYFNQGLSRRKLKLHWNAEERLWKITMCVRDINRIAILDSISGSEAPDYRFLLKTCYKIKIKDEFTKIINEIQSRNSFSLRDGMWFRVEDFEGKLDKVEIRQTVSKKRFFNKRFQISVVHIKQDSGDAKLFVQQTTSLKNRSWRSVENIDQNLSLHYDEQDIRNTICETIQSAREIVKALS